MIDEYDPYRWQRAAERKAAAEERARQKRADQRAQHTCVMKASSMGCLGCARGIPYPALTLEDLGPPRKEQDMAHHQVSVKGTTYDRLKAAAEAQGVTISTVVELALSKDLGTTPELKKAVRRRPR